MPQIVLALGFVLAGTSGAVGFLGPAGRYSSGSSRTKSTPYVPREGDLIFYDDHSVFWNVMFALAGSGPPLHVGIVVRRRDGSIGVLEAGPNDTIKVGILDLRKQLRDFEGTITVRRCKTMLPSDKSDALTKFAEAQEGKTYAVLRLILQGTCFRCRGPIRELFLGHTYLDRSTWICSELAVAAGTVAGLFNPTVVHANVLYPEDLVDNHRFDLSRCFCDAQVWTASSEKSR